MKYDRIRYEFEFTTDVWTDVADYVKGVDTGRMGFTGWGPLDRVASTGSYSFSLLNEDHQFTPKHTGCVEGFQVGTNFRLTLEYDGVEITRFYGRVSAINFYVLNTYLMTNVTVTDYMDRLASHELELPEFAQNKKIEDVVALILANMTIAPLNTEYGTGQDTFASVFDTVKARTFAITELSKVAQSELGYIYVKHGLKGATNGLDGSIGVAGAGTTAVNGTYAITGTTNSHPEYENSGGYILWFDISDFDRWVFSDAAKTTHYYHAPAYLYDDNSTPDLVPDSAWDVIMAGIPSAPTVGRGYSATDEILVTEGRYTRKGEVLATVDGADAIFNTNVIDVAMSHGKYYYNAVKTITYPRKVDADATSVLFTLNRYIAIQPGETATVVGRFIDPNQEAQSITGTAMVTPVATTDYLFNAASDGSGSNITADLGVVATYGANGVEYELTNNNAGMGYVTFLQARGKGVYTYRPVEYEVQNAAEVAAFGKATLNLPMMYQQNPIVGEDFANNLIDLYSTRRTVIEAINLEIISEFLLKAFMELQVGDKIQIVVPEADVDDQFFIYGIEFTIEPSGFVQFSYRVISDSLMPSADYWELDSATLSQLGTTTTLGF